MLKAVRLVACNNIKCRQYREGAASLACHYRRAVGVISFNSKCHRIGGRSASFSSQPPRKHSTSARQKSFQSIKEISHAIKVLGSRPILGNPIPPFWVGESIEDDSEDRRLLFQESSKLLNNIVASVENGIISPTEKNGRELTAGLGEIQRIICATLQTDEQESSFQECERIMSLLQKWNLSCQPHHYHYSIMAAVREKRWKSAALLFQKQIDPDAFGYTPVDISIVSPTGLYALARLAQEERTPVVEQVFDAVLNLSMISPKDQDKYVLAAGTALGLADESDSFIKYLANSYHANQLGQPLLASAMQTCLLCDRPDDALDLFDDYVVGKQSSREFQWGGGEDQVSPLCRDLVIRALGQSERMHLSPQALELFWQAMEDGFTISYEAHRGVLAACERDGAWEEAVEVFFTVLDLSKQREFLVQGNQMIIPEKDNMPDRQMNHSVRLESALGSLMRVCNSQGKFGVALLASIFFQRFLVSGCDGNTFDVLQQRLSLIHNDADDDESLQTLLSLFAMGLDSPDEILSATMVSLCGLGDHRQASHLFECVKAMANVSAESTSAADFDSYERLVDSQQVRDYLMSDESQVMDGLRGKWESMNKHLARIAHVLQIIGEKQPLLVIDQQQRISNALATTLRICTSVGQPEAGLLLSARMQAEASQDKRKDARVFKLSMYQSNQIYDCDSLLAQTMFALHACDQTQLALDVFHSQIVQGNKPRNKWGLSYNAAIHLLFESHQQEDAMQLFREVIESTKSMDSMVMVSRALGEAHRWNEILDVYRFALVSGCLSEELGLIAMKSTIEANTPQRLRVLRGIIGDIASASGMTPMTWMEQKYWDFKKLLGFQHARLLMWWNDPETCHLDELELALDAIKKDTLDVPKEDILKLIVSHAIRFKEGDFPPGRRDLRRIPRDRVQWINVLHDVLAEASASLLKDANFIDEVVLAFRNLDGNFECVEFLENTLAEKAIWSRPTLVEAYHTVSGSESATSRLVDSTEIKMIGIISDK